MYKVKTVCSALPLDQRSKYRYTPKGAICKSGFIRMARLIMAGDMDQARKMRDSGEECCWYSMGMGYGEVQGWYPKSKSVAEARAIIGACLAAGKMYGIKIDPWTLHVRT